MSRHPALKGWVLADMAADDARLQVPCAAQHKRTHSQHMLKPHVLESAGISIMLGLRVFAVKFFWCCSVYMGATAVLVWPTSPACCASMWHKAGSPKARVLPEPVAAMPTTSRPDKMMGQHCAWMGDGAAKSSVACSNSAGKPATGDSATLSMSV